MPAARPAFWIPLVTLLAGWPLVRYGFPAGHDWPFELVRLSEYRTALADGQWPPYWGSNLYHGYGSPIFTYYGGLYCLVASLLSLGTTFLADAAAWTMVLFAGVGALGMYLLAGSLLPDGPAGRVCARLACTFFLLHPYLIGDRLVRNANAEHTALCLAPMAFYGLVHLGKSPIRGTLIFATAMGCIIFAHNLTSVVAFPLAIFGAILLYPPGRQSVRLGYAVAGLLLALMLSSFFWVPVWTLMELVTTQDPTTGKFDFHNNFDDAGGYFGFGTFYSSGILTPLVLLAGCLILLLDKEFPNSLRPRLALLLLLAAVFLFLLHPLSTPVWERVPLLPLFQFPWRFMGPLAILAALILAMVGYRLLEHRTGHDLMIRELIFLLAVGLQSLPVTSLYQSVHTRLSPMELEQRLTADYIRTNGLMAMVPPDHFFPRIATRAGKQAAPPLATGEPAAPVGTIGLDQRDGLVREIKIQTSDATLFPLDIWAFPVVEAQVNGQAVSLAANQPGTWSLPLPAGVSDIRIRLHPPTPRFWALWVTLLAAALSLGGFGWSLIRRR